MNLPNKLTILRACMIPVFVVLALMTPFWAQLTAAIVFALASFTDYLDGHIARKHNLVTNFGKFMDPIADKLLVMSAFVVLVGQGRMPSWACIIVLGREFVISGFRLVAADAGRVIAAGPLGKIKTVTQMAAVLLLLLLSPVTGDAPLLGEGGKVFADVVMYISTFFSLVSCVDYITRNRDCLKDR